MYHCYWTVSSSFLKNNVEIKSLLQMLSGRLIVSCQAPDDDPFRDSDSIARFARAAERGGAAGLRVNGPRDVEAVRKASRLPIIGIQKREHSDGHTLITPFFSDASDLIAAGAQIVAIECTVRAQQAGALDLIRRVRRELGVLVMADVATLAEAVAAEEAGAGVIASTMRGYTAETASISLFEPVFIAELAARISAPIIAEGRIETPDQAVQALDAGAISVVVGTAITRPETITSRFVAALTARTSSVDGAAAKSTAVIGLDLGGTNTKAAILSPDDTLECLSTEATPAHGKNALIDHIAAIARRKMTDASRKGMHIEAVGVATAGWVNPADGRVVYATDNLPGWTGTNLAGELEDRLGRRVAVENDANAFAIAERHFGAARGVNDFICLTLGTGVGGAVYSGARLLRGNNHLASAIGHIVIHADGEPCSCGLRGCLERYANAAALLRLADGRYPDVEKLIEDGQAKIESARQPLAQYAKELSLGLISLIHVLDPELIVLAGGIAENNSFLVEQLRASLAERVIAPKLRRLRIVRSNLGYHGAAYGAGIAARMALGLLPEGVA